MEVKLAAKFSTSFSQLSVQRSSDSSALACCKAGLGFKSRHGTSVVDPLYFHADLDVTYTLMRIQILIFI